MTAAVKQLTRTRRPRILLPLLAAVSATAWLAPRLVSFAVGGRPSRGITSSTGTSSLALRAAGSAAEAGASMGAAIGGAIGGGLEDVLKTPRAEAKDVLLRLLEDKGLAAEVLSRAGKPARGRVDEAIVGLEGLNPTEEPVYSDLLDGRWVVRYSGSYAPGVLSSPTRELALFLYGGGFSLGNALSSFANGFWGQTLGVAVSNKTVQISGLGRDVEASAQVEIAGRKRTLTYSAELLPLSARRMSEEVMELRFPGPLGTQKPPLELQRGILVTYLDKDVMIVRDESGLPEVLVRELRVIPVSEMAPKSTFDGNATNAAEKEVEARVD